VRVSVAWARGGFIKISRKYSKVIACPSLS